MNNERVTLYIAEHNVTGLKYFGKTIRHFTEQDLQEKYHGSGTYWKRHIKKHGDDVTMSIYRICSLDENEEDYVEPIALKFSEENDIVDSKEWANLCIEDGLDLSGIPGRLITEDYRKKLSNSMKGKKKTQEHKRNLSESMKGVIPYNKDTKMADSQKQKIRKSSLNKIISEETKAKMRKQAKNRERVECPHCLKVVDICVVKRWHFDNCKFKNMES